MLVQVLSCVIAIYTTSACDPGKVVCPEGAASAGICVPAGPAGKASCREKIWNNIFASTEARVTSLLDAMNLSEKLSLLATQKLPHQANYVERLGLGPPATGECLHGVIGKNFTVFPQSISLAATFDTDLLKRVGKVIGIEMRAKVNDQARNRPMSEHQLPVCLGPQINIVRDPRWGRAQETYGEDPLLTGNLALAIVRGMRGDDPRTDLVGVVPKHFDAYNGATTRGSYSISEVKLSYEDWAETYLPHWAALMPAKPVGVMCSYNTLCLVDNYDESCSPPSHGVPACANHKLLQGVLRDDWNFKGFVISDAGAIQFLETDHRYAQSQIDAAALAVKAGCDLDLGGGESAGQCKSFGCLRQSMEKGLVNVSDVDRALKRQLIARVVTGNLNPVEEQPYRNLSVAANVSTSAHRSLALEAAHKSVVLLKNTGCLPLNAAIMSLPGEIAVVGPNADKYLFGNYNGVNKAVSILDGIKTYSSRLSYHYGVNLTAPPSQGDVMAAVAAAAVAEVTVAVMGIDQSQEYEGGTRSDIVLPGFQSQLLDELRVNAKTLVVILVGGSAMAIPWIERNADAVLWVGYGGEEAGTAVADVLFGAVSPSGKLPMTWYQGLEQLPPFSSMDMRAHPGRTYRFLREMPLYSFGFGLSYAKMSVGLLQAPQSLQRCDQLSLRVRLTHQEGMPMAEEVVQVFVTRAKPFRRSLGAFLRSRALNVTESQDLTLVVPASVFTVQHGVLAVWEAGQVQVFISLRGVYAYETSFKINLTGATGPCGNTTRINGMGDRQSADLVTVSFV